MSKKSVKRARVNLRIHTDLLKWSKRFAKKKNTSLTQIVIDRLTELRLNTEGYVELKTK